MPELKSERKRIALRFIYLPFPSKWDSCPAKLFIRTMYKCYYLTICWATEMTLLACSPMSEKVVYPPGRCWAYWLSRDLCLSKGFLKWRSSTSTYAAPLPPTKHLLKALLSFLAEVKEERIGCYELGAGRMTQICLTASGLLIGRLGFSAYSHVFVPHLQMYPHVSKYISEQRRVT